MSAPPPASEEELCGLVLLAPDLWHDLAERVRLEDFGHPHTACVWAAISRTMDQGGSLTLGRVASNARKVPDDVTLGPYLATLMQEASDARADPVAVQDIADGIAEAARKRRMAERAAKAIADARNPEITADDLLSGILEDMVVAGGVRSDRYTASLPSLMARVAGEVSQGRPARALVPVGIPEIEDLGGTWGAGDLIVLGARSGDGKTALAMQAAVFVGRSLPVEFFQLEMDGLAVAERHLASETGVPMRRLRSGIVEAHERDALVAAAAAVKGNRLVLRWRPRATTAMIRGTVLATKAREGRVGLVVVDHNKLVRVAQSGRRLDRIEQIALAMDDLKALAKEAECPVLMLAQMTREGQKRLAAGGWSKRELRPHRYDLYGGGDMEEYADVILLAHRPETILPHVEPVAGRKGKDGLDPHDEWKAAVAYWKGKAELIADKVRSGPGGGTVEMKWNGERTRYESLPSMLDPWWDR
jgi:replicative DNA helicase